MPAAPPHRGRFGGAPTLRYMQGPTGPTLPGILDPAA